MTALQKSFVFLVFIGISSFTFGQKQGLDLIDSLEARLPKAKEDTNKVNLLLDLSFEYARFEPKKTIYFGKKALILAQQMEFRTGEAGANRNIGMGYGAQSLFPAALEYYFKALKIYEEEEDGVGVGKVKLSIGLIYSGKENHDKALFYYLGALTEFKKANHRPAIAKALNNIGVEYTHKRQFKKALKIYRESLVMKLEEGDPFGIESNISNIAGVNYEMGQLDTSLVYYLKAIEINKETTANTLFLAVHTCSLGNIYLKMVETNDKRRLKKYAGGSREKALLIAKDYFNEGIPLFNEIGNVSDVFLYYKSMSKTLELLGDTEGSLNYYKRFEAAKDSVRSQENTEKMVTQELQFDFDKKEAVAKKELQHAQWVSNGFIGGFSVMLLFSIVFLSQRNRIRKGKKRSDELLLNILPEEVAEELKLKGAADARQYDEVSILFTDFKGFTELSEKMSPRELVAEIDYCFRKFDEIITKYHIEKIKTIGDAYMAVSGLPVESPEHAINMVAAALEIRDFMEAYKQERRAENKLFFEVRIGIHTGEVVAGIVGVKKFAYDVWGDSVNTAARMESSGEVGKVNISETTYQLVRSHYDCAFRGEIEAKGKGKVNMYFVEYQTEEVAV